jgi:hypothetical protein
MTKWDYLTLSHTLSPYSDEMGSHGPFSEGLLLDLWDSVCPSELELIGSESHDDFHGGELHMIGLAHALVEFVTSGFLARDANGSLWIGDPPTFIL